MLFPRVRAPAPEGTAMPASETQTETIIQAAGKTAPRLRPEDIDGVIVGETYWRCPGTTLTICVLHLRNGFTVTGESAAVSLENFDEAIGKMIARNNARSKIWALEGYLLRDRLATVTEATG